MSRDHSLPKSRRLHLQADFDRVHRANVYAADAVLVVRAAPNNIGVTRLGISISRKAGTAVVRNRWKRLIREAFRLQRERIPEGLDLVVRPRLGAVPDNVAVRSSLVALASRLARRAKGRT
jgi:ribonuclease P protein component